VSDIAGVLVFVLGFAGCVVALSGILAPLVTRHATGETLTERWRRLTGELPR
jgi:energy-converting hydrogenase Eha subunit G